MALKLITAATALAGSGIYAITCLTNNKVYVGSAVSFRGRLKSHLSALRHGKHHSEYLQNCWTKYGEENFSFEVLEHVTDKNTLLAREQIAIDSRKSYDRKFGFNVCRYAGSPLGRKASEETKEKLRQRMMGNTHLLGHFPGPETIEKLKATRVGKTPALGMKHTEEVKANISKMFKGKALKAEHAEKISLALKGKEKSAEHRRALSIVQARFSVEQVMEIRNKYSGGKVTMREIAKEHHVCIQTIGNVINKRRQAYQ
jgi:group I intron endonuclease